MNLTILGKYAPYPPAGGATPGFLISEGKTNILIECGSGVLSRMQTFLPLQKLSAVVITSLQYHHFSDVFALRNALQQVQQRGKFNSGPIKVFVPSQPRMEYTILRSGQNVFEMIDILDDMRVMLGDLEISFHMMRQRIPSFGLLMYSNERAFAYTGATGMHDNIIPFAMGVDCLLADTGLLEREKTGPLAPHLTTKEAGYIARSAGVKRLLCTHLSPLMHEEEVQREVARELANAEITQEMHTYVI